MTLYDPRDILLSQGGGYIYEIVFIVLSITISHNVISYYYILKKSKYVLSNSILAKHKSINFNSRIIQTYFAQIKERLSNYNYPYKLNFKRYIFIKYFLSVIFSIISFVIYSNIFISIIYGISVFFLPNMLIKIFAKSENMEVYKELYTITQNIILSLTVKLTFYKSLKLCLENIAYDRFRIEFGKFINDYEMYNFSIQKAVQRFSKKFQSYELSMFLNVLIQSENEGNMVENLENYIKSLDAVYYKRLKQNMMRRTLYVSFATILTLINILMIVLYPMFVQITDGINLIFK